MRAVVVDGAHDDRAGPGRNIGKVLALQTLILGAGCQVVHLAVAAFGNPSREILELGKVTSRRNSAEIKAGFARPPTDLFLQ